MRLKERLGRNWGRNWDRSLKPAGVFLCALLAGAAITTVATGFAGEAQAKRKAGKLTVRHVPKKRMVVLYWKGTVARPMANEIRDAFELYRNNDVQRFVLSLSSGGGYVSEGVRVIEVMRKIKQGFRLDTVVDRGNMCGSMCIPIYLQGQTRYAAHASTWLFHEIGRADSKTGRVTVIDPQRTDEIFDRYYATTGVTKAWLDDLKRRIKGNDIWLTGRELFAKRTGIAHRAIGSFRDRGIRRRLSRRPPTISDDGSDEADDDGVTAPRRTVRNRPPRRALPDLIPGGVPGDNGTSEAN
ncbi:MAG: hypothetical protein AAFR04_05930 [Pseudomonadota bacterium]